MQCPRCGEKNSGRAACWNCFAQLDAATGGQTLKKVQAQPVSVAPVQPETAQSPEAGPATPDMPDFSVPTGEPPTAPAGESVDPSKYVVPGLAEERKTPAARATERPRRAVPSRRGFPIVPVAIAVVLVGIVVAWWFML